MTATPNWGNLRHCGSARRGGARWLTALDSRLTAGFTIIPYLDPFTANWLDLDPQGLNDHVEIVSSSTTVVPDSGAAVKVKFVTRTGYPRFAHVTLPDGARPRWARRCSTTTVGRLAPSVRAGCCMPECRKTTAASR